MSKIKGGYTCPDCGRQIGDMEPHDCHNRGGSHPKKTRKHRWSGWPGAYCLDCGTDDPAEMALSLGWMSFIPNKKDPTKMAMVYDTEDHRKLVEQLDICIPIETLKREDGGCSFHAPSTHRNSDVRCNHCCECKCHLDGRIKCSECCRKTWSH